MIRRNISVARRIAATSAIVLIVSTGCSNNTGSDAPGQAPLITAATLGEQRLLSASQYLAEPPYATADLDNGAQQAQICRACHSLERGGPVMIGPVLFGMFGAPAGRRPDFDYSRALAEAEFVWTPRALDAWLAEPTRFLPGNRMSFAGVRDMTNRVDLVAYLLKVTDDSGKQE